MLQIYPFYPKFIAKHEEAIRGFLKFKPGIWSQASHTFNHMKEHYCLGSGSCTWVAIHVRIGDYGYHLQRIFNESLLITTDYISRAMDYFQNRYPVRPTKQCL